jgi:hypothetical protein
VASFVSSDQPSPPTCGTAVERAVLDRLARLAAATTRDRIHARAAAPLAFPVYPMAGRLWEDVDIGYHVDVDPNRSAAAAFDCSPPHTYDGHTGTDAKIRSFAVQHIGVAVVAAEDGMVVALHDGEFDEVVVCRGNPKANWVVIDHGGGFVSGYLHLKKNSISVAVGQSVCAGEQIALVGSSGCSNGPHLHFDVWQDGVGVDPFSGPCQPGASLPHRRRPSRQSRLQGSASPVPPLRWPTPHR